MAYVQQPNTGAARGVALTTSSGVTGMVTGTGEGEYCGLTGYETTGSNPVTVLLYDGTTAGVLLEACILAKGTSTPPMFYPRPARQVVTGIYAVITGGFNGSVWQ